MRSSIRPEGFAGVVVVAGLLVGSAACTGGGRATTGPTASPSVFTSATVATGSPAKTGARATATLPLPAETDPSVLPGDTSGYDVVCGGTGVPAAPEYRGPGPHPMTRINTTIGNRPGLDKDYPPIPSAWETNDVHLVQLVACVTMRPGAFIRRCRYEGSFTEEGRLFTLTLSGRSYTVDIRSARTGKRIGPTRRLLAANTACPKVLAPFVGESPDPLFSDLSPAQVQALYGRWILANR